MILALLLGIVSLCMRSSKASGTIAYSSHQMGARPGTLAWVQREADYYPMGIEMKPWGFTVCVCLLLVFITPLCKIGIWRLSIYWISVLLLLIFLPFAIGVTPWVACAFAVWAAVLATRGMPARGQT